MAMTLQFLGATEEVTGSCHLLSVNQQQLLLDCGLIQGGKTDIARNRAPFEFEPSEIFCVVLSHAHIDHSGRLPALVQQGFDGPIYTHQATAELCEILLRDAAMLQQRDTERVNKRRDKQQLPPLEPLFTEADVEQVLSHFIPLEYDQLVPVMPGVDIMLHDAGHILGSALVELFLNDGEQQKKLVFSGDLGRAGMPILRDPTMIDSANLVLMESTYGERLHRSWDDTLAELKTLFAETIQSSRGNILIPAFSVGRAQELLYLFHLYAKQWQLAGWTIVLDSPMAIEATRIYVRNYPLMDADFQRLTQLHPGEHPLLSHARFIRDTAESISLNEISHGLIIIAGSGMCNGGRIRCHLQHNLARENSDVIICGFQALGTPGRLLVDGAEELTISGQSIPVRARIHTVGGLSAHADQAELLRWYQHFDGAPPLVLVHGEPTAQQVLLAKLAEQSPTTRAVIATHADTLDLTALPALRWC
ncbi:MBL fold metallo-hydrolase [Shewanella sp. C32]|uniref:MBL fold metallo-hydrolase n=1 Tax=Shewanella electrica TaxID=515560 RepID=A0ABT2FP62_9GAMM|nr:MBL fold metallo-hydrolase [Shewanella electrica]MCH1925623.1 MBL fold metallo-hydrolase [Shewanella electrica]MCS4558129.1 MBL fold metallo-hydrolase [Shewanella electrica]